MKRLEMRRIIITVTAILGAIALLLLGAILYRAFTTAGPSPIPEDIQDKLTFSPLVIPDTNEDFVTKSYKLASENSDAVPVLSYVITTTDGKYSITASEYTQPSEFSDIQEYKSQFLSNIAKQYATVQSSNGTIYLGRQAKQDNKQLAVMVEKGLLVFFVPSGDDVDETTWRKLGDALITVKQ